MRRGATSATTRWNLLRQCDVASRTTNINGEGRDFRPSARRASEVALADDDRESGHEHALASAHMAKVLG
jgi:hypothetical protein